MIAFDTNLQPNEQSSISAHKVQNGKNRPSDDNFKKKKKAKFSDQNSRLTLIFPAPFIIQ